jgi:hypothetical protein
MAQRPHTIAIKPDFGRNHGYRCRLTLGAGHGSSSGESKTRHFKTAISVEKPSLTPTTEQYNANHATKRFSRKKFF